MADSGYAVAMLSACHTDVSLWKTDPGRAIQIFIASKKHTFTYVGINVTLIPVRAWV
jgi:hypothetical protein